MRVRVTILACWAISLQACAGPIAMDSLKGIDRTTSSRELHDAVGREPERMESLRFDGRSFTVESFNIITGSILLQTSGPYGPIYSQQPTSDRYVFIFENNRLVTWGFPSELKNDQDTFVRSLATVALKELDSP